MDHSQKITMEKRERKQSAQKLPPGLSQDMMRKYVVYYREYVNAEKTRTREFFKVEKHPALGSKPWISSKSNKVSLMTKLHEANKVVDDLEKGIHPGEVNKGDGNGGVGDNVTNVGEIKLPKYVTVVKPQNAKPYLLYDYRDHENGYRWTQRMTLPYGMEYDMHEQLEKLKQLLYDKYMMDMDF